MKHLNNAKGESLIELLISVALLGIVIVVFLRALTSLVSINKQTDIKLNSTYMAERTMEYLVSKADMPINTFVRTIRSSVDFDCTDISTENPYIFKVVYDDFQEIYAIITIDYRYYTRLGHMSRVKVEVFDDENTSKAELTTALYWE